MEKKYVFSFDCETNGLWGRAWSVAAVILDMEGKEVDKFVGRCPITGKINPWVKENVLPMCKNIKINYKSYRDMLYDFSKFYLKYKDTSHIVAHIAIPVESKLIIDMRKYHFIGEFDTPYPLIDISALLLYHGFDPTSVDRYNKEKEIEIPEVDGGTHNPLFDSYSAGYAFLHLMKN